MSLGYGNANENPEELALIVKFLTATNAEELVELVRGYVDSIPQCDRIESLTTIVAQLAQFVRLLEQHANFQGVRLLDDLTKTIDRLEFDELTKDLDLDVE